MATGMGKAEMLKAGWLTTSEQHQCPYKMASSIQ